MSFLSSGSRKHELFLKARYNIERIRVRFARNGEFKSMSANKPSAVPAPPLLPHEAALFCCSALLAPV
jgi:hypothetical protein